MASGYHSAVVQPAAGSRRPQPTARWRIAWVLCVALLIALVALGCSGTQPPSSLPVDSDPGLVHIHGLEPTRGMVRCMPQPTPASSSSGTVVPAGLRIVNRTPWASL
jgi:hypothetical protein